MSLHLDVMCRDTICAPATAPGRSALCLIRVSGPAALSIKDRVFKPKRNVHLPFTATLGEIIDENSVLDEVVCTYFPDHRSFTGEPSFEISAHGNPLIMNSILALLVKHGCRNAGPGEFSLRSVMRGKMDLAQAESISDLIDAQSPQGISVALRNLRGGLEKVLEPVRQTLISTLCEIEARLDFPDEGISERHKEELRDGLKQAARSLKDLICRSSKSSKLMQGYRVVLYGKPNAGKSTLLNALIGEERSIVHETEGTTRDVLEISWQINQIPIVLVDVAGIRNDDNIHPVEAIGIERAKKEIERADLIVNLLDLSNPESAPLLEASVPILEVYTKSDLVKDISFLSDKLSISAKLGVGLEELISRIGKFVSLDLPDSQGILLTRLRHVELVKNSLNSLEQALDAFGRNLSDECVAYDIREACRFLDELFGKQLNEEVLDLIFSRFCIGK